jgi:hypothetical protein
MKKIFKQVYQFKIKLKDIRPPVWRRIQVPESYTFWDLHVAIQDAFGWEDYHLHQFELVDPMTGEKIYIGIPDEISNDVLPGWKHKIAKYLSIENPKATYLYDFGDGWEHSVLLEKILPREKGVNYPRCINGKRACPPEDCGGTWGYTEFLEIIKDPKHEQHKEMLTWVGGDFDPEYFNIEEICFDDPDERLKDL